MSCRTAVRWLYRLDANFSWASGHPIDADRVFFDREGKLRLIIERDGRITVTRGYAWNGCSPKVCVFDLLLGTPEGAVHRDTGRPKTYHASLVHDALYQFLAADAQLTRRDADAMFRQLLREADFAPASIYWLAVRLFGWLVRRGKDAKRKWAGTSEVVANLPPHGVSEPEEPDDLPRA
jgi:hypothetical protein